MIKSTNDYTIFKILECNRDIRENHVSVLMNSISTKNLLRLNPILVDQELRVIDGQHRLEACKRLGIEVWYKIEEKINHEDIILLQNQRKWGMEDFIKYYSKTGNQEYIKLQKFIEKNQLSSNRFLKILSRKGSHYYRQIRQGNMKFPDELADVYLEFAFKMNYVEKFINDRRSDIKNVTSSISFHCAFYSFLQRKDVNFDELMSKIEQKIDIIGIRSKEGGYYSLLLEIYNHRRKEPLAYNEKDR